MLGQLLDMLTDSKPVTEEQLRETAASKDVVALFNPALTLVTFNGQLFLFKSSGLSVDRAQVSTLTYLLLVPDEYLTDEDIEQKNGLKDLFKADNADVVINDLIKLQDAVGSFVEVFRVPEEQQESISSEMLKEVKG